MMRKKLTDEEIWEKYNISGGFREPGGRVAIPIDISDIPPELQDIARKVKERCDKEAQKNK